MARSPIAGRLIHFLLTGIYQGRWAERAQLNGIYLVHPIVLMRAPEEYAPQPVSPTPDHPQRYRPISELHRQPAL